MATLPGLRSRCPACGRSLSNHERFAGDFCSDWQCRHKRLLEEQHAALSARLQALRDAAAQAAGGGDIASAPVIRVRYYENGLGPVTPSQRQALRAHLMGLEAEVRALQEAEVQATEPPKDDDGGISSFPAEPEIDALLGQVCARCTGHCCRLGFGRHAFLDAPALRRAQRQQPEADFEMLVERYLQALPEQHHAGSCGFHGAQGCVLPRTQRATICNIYECPGLEQTRQLAETEGVRRVFVVRHDAEHEPVGAFAPPL